MKSSHFFIFIAFIIVPFLSFSQSNLALSFGGNDHVDLGSSVGNEVRTIELWFLLYEEIDTTLADYQTLITREVNAINEDEFALWFRPSVSPTTTYPGTLTFRFSDDVNNQYRVFSDSNHWEPGIWHHVAVVIDPALGIRMFIDGKLQSSTHPHNQATAIRNEITMVGGFGSNPVIRHFNGIIDDVRLSKDVEYTSNFTPHCPNIQASSGTTGLFNFEEGSGNVVADSSGFQRDGAIVGAQYVKACICNTGNNLFFDGQNTFVDLGPDVGNNVRTIELWFKPYRNIDSGNPDYQTLVTREVNAVNDDEFALWFLPSSTSYAGQLVFRYSEDINNQFRIFSDTSSWKENTWYHVAIVISPSIGMRMFIDGKRQSSIHNNNKATTSVMVNTTVGAFGSGAIRKFYGQIDDVHFSSEALYNKNFVPPCPDRSPLNSTLGLWYFNEGSGVVAFDAGVLGHHGEIHSASYVCDSVCKTTVGISEIISQNKVKLYPNPSNGKLFINVKDSNLRSKNVSIRILTIEGKEIMKTNFYTGEHTFEISLPSNLSQGMYILETLFDDQQLFRDKILFLGK